MRYVFWPPLRVAGLLVRVLVVPTGLFRAILRELGGADQISERPLIQFALLPLYGPIVLLHHLAITILLWIVVLNVRLGFVTPGDGFKTAYQYHPDPNADPETAYADFLQSIYRSNTDERRGLLYAMPVAPTTDDERLKDAALKNPAVSGRQAPNIEEFSAEIKNALTELALADSPVGMEERARNIHALAKVQADALVEKCNALSKDSPLVNASASALAELVVAMSQVETYALKDYPIFARAPKQVQESWTGLMGAAVNDEARALARGLAAYRQLHGLGH